MSYYYHTLKFKNRTLSYWNNIMSYYFLALKLKNGTRIYTDQADLKTRISISINRNDFPNPYCLIIHACMD